MTSICHAVASRNRVVGTTIFTISLPNISQVDFCVRVAICVIRFTMMPEMATIATEKAIRITPSYASKITVCGPQVSVKIRSTSSGSTPIAVIDRKMIVSYLLVFLASSTPFWNVLQS